MSNFVIAHKGRIVGIADYIDEAFECAERLAGRPANAMWCPATGEMIVDGQALGWSILRPKLEGMA
jgi:hypothetical protein